MPPEFWLLPKIFPIHPGSERMLSFLDIVFRIIYLLNVNGFHNQKSYFTSCVLFKKLKYGPSSFALQANSCATVDWFTCQCHTYTVRGLSKK